MRLHILAIGNLRAGPERLLIDDYLTRASRTGRQVGIRDVSELEIASGGSPSAESDRILARRPPAALTVCLDETGRQMTSRELAQWIARHRDSGVSDVCFLIGGASGHDPKAKQVAELVLGFGPQTWPHKLVRVMLAEQLYRATSLLAGTPYHKD